MKTLLLLVSFLFTPLFSSIEEQNIDAIAKALGSGNVETLATYFDTQVEISIMAQEGTYDKAKAKEVMQGFYAKNKVSNFKQVHQGLSKGKDTQYFIGNLSAGGTTYRTYIYLKTVGGKSLIQVIRLDKE